MLDLRTILDQAAAVAPRAVEFRRRIHSRPELSFAEHETAAYIESVLSAEGIEFRRIAGTGVLAKIEGMGDLRDAVVLRADIDALPIEEHTGEEFASRNPGVMHACGHDMHTAALLGAAIVLDRLHKELKGTVFAIFQPGEECNPGGASLVLKEDPFEGYNVRAVIGEHVDPDLPTGVFGFRPGKYMASSDEVRITVTGEGGHAALPWKLKDPVVAAAALITALREVVKHNPDPQLPTVLGFGRVIADGATNIIPDTVKIAGTLRTFDEGWRAGGKRLIREISAKVAAEHGVGAQVDISEGFPCVENDPRVTARAIGLTEQLFGPGAVVPLELRTTAEDFGFYTHRYPSVFYRFGVDAATCACRERGAPAGRVHTSTFNPDERSLEFAVAGLVNLAANI